MSNLRLQPVVAVLLLCWSPLVAAWCLEPEVRIAQMQESLDMYKLGLEIVAANGALLANDPPADRSLRHDLITGSPHGQVELGDHPKVPAVVRQDRTFVAMRPVFEFLGAQVTFTDGLVRAVREGHACALTVGSTEATVDDAPVTLEEAPFLLEGTTMVPLRFVVGAMGAETGYESTSYGGIITIKLGEAFLRIPVVGDRGEHVISWLDRYGELRALRAETLKDASDSYLILPHAEEIGRSIELHNIRMCMSLLGSLDYSLQAVYYFLMAELPQAGETARVLVSDQFQAFAKDRVPWERDLLREERETWQRLARQDPSAKVRQNASAVVAAIP